MSFVDAERLGADNRAASSTTGASSATIWLPNLPSAIARAALACERSAYSSRSSRPKPQIAASRSAPSNWVVISQWLANRALRASPNPGTDEEPIGTRVIDSTPPAMATSTRPAATVDDGYRLLGRAALSVDRGGRRREGQPGAEPRVTGDVPGLLNDLADTARHDLLYHVRRHGGPVERSPVHVTQQVRRIAGRQRSLRLPTAERTAFTITTSVKAVSSCSYRPPVSAVAG